MNFSQLKFIKAVAELESFSRAAEFCSVTQPTLSNGVAKLEDELGKKIFIRTTRSVTTTHFGRSLLPIITSILTQQSFIYSSAKDYADPETVVLKIGMSPLISTKIIAPMTHSFKSQHPKFEILFTEDNLSTLDEKLAHQALDLILVPTVKKSKSKHVLSLYEEDLYFISDHQQEAKTKVQLNDIRDQTFVMVPDSCGLAELTRSLLRTTRTEIKEYEGKALSYQVLADWATHGLGAAVLPKSKIPLGMPKQQIYKAAKPMKIFFEARWVSSDNAALHKLLQHFEQNIHSMVAGMVG